MNRPTVAQWRLIYAIRYAEPIPIHQFRSEIPPVT